MKEEEKAYWWFVAGVVFLIIGWLVPMAVCLLIALDKEIG